MKRILLLVLTLILSFVDTIVAQKFVGGFDHIMEVARYNDWGKDYLTITDTHVMHFRKANGSSENDGYYSVTMNAEASKWVAPNNDTLYIAPSNSDLVLTVNGKSAKGWSKNDFYKATDNGEPFVLGYRKKLIHTINGKPEVFIIDLISEIKPKTKLPKLFDSKFQILNSVNIAKRKYGKTPEQERKSYNNPGFYETLKDDEFDFFYAKTYDYLIQGNDPLKDKSILEEAHFTTMVRSANNPDLLITIAKNVDESISTTYVPPTSRVVNTGSSIRAQYNYVTKRTDYIVTQNNQTIHEGGYNQETKTSDLFLEIAALDAKKINDPKISYAPIVWQMTYKRHTVNPGFDPQEELKVAASWAIFPPEDRECIDINKDGKPNDQSFYSELGVVIDASNKKLLADVLPGSLAEEVGLKAGDIIVSAICPSFSKTGNRNLKKNIQSAGWYKLQSKDVYDNERYNCIYQRYELTILRDKKKIIINIVPHEVVMSKYTYLKDPE